MQLTAEMKPVLGSVHDHHSQDRLSRFEDSLGGQFPVSQPSSRSLGDCPFGGVGLRFLVKDPRMSLKLQ